MPYEFKSKPFAHQLKEWTEHRHDEARGILWEQGVGKSKEVVDQASALWMEDRIDAVLVVAPNGVHRNWVDDEIPDHTPLNVAPHVRALAFNSSKAGTVKHIKAVKALIAHQGLAWLTISYDAFMTVAGKRALIEFLDQRKVYFVLDESQNIKNPEAKRTESILMAAKYAVIRRILSGTPVSIGPIDMYPQMEWLKAGFWEEAGFDTFTEFRTHFGVYKKGWNPNGKTYHRDDSGKVTKVSDGAEYEILVECRNLDQLNDIIRPMTSRLRKDDVLDLPAKLYQKRYFTMGAEQARLYGEMRAESMAWIREAVDELTEAQAGAVTVAEEGAAPQAVLGGCPRCFGRKEIEEEGFFYKCPECTEEGADFIGGEGVPVIAKLAMVRLLRLQQITCGYLPTDDEAEPVYRIPGANPRLEALMQVVDATQGKIIVWARFQLDITSILEALAQRGISAVRYDGLVGEDERAEAKARFKGERTIMDRGQVVGREAVPESEQARVFVGNPAAGATGLTLTVAKTVVYYSNNFKLIDRLQSEDRAHRIGQTENVTYVDLIAEDTVDMKIVESLRSKLHIARQIVGDDFKEWL